MTEEEIDQNAKARDLAAIAFGLALLAFFLSLIALYFDFGRSRSAGVLGIFGLILCLIVGFIQKKSFGNYYGDNGYDDALPPTLHRSHRSSAVKLAIAWVVVGAIFLFAAVQTVSYSSVGVAAIGICCGTILVIALYTGDQE